MLWYQSNILSILEKVFDISHKKQFSGEKNSIEGKCKFFPKNNSIFWDDCEASLPPTVPGATVSCDGAESDGDICTVTANADYNCNGVTVSCSNDSRDYVVDGSCFEGNIK
jgi:hypothetical protein